MPKKQNATDAHKKPTQRKVNKQKKKKERSTVIKDKDTYKKYSEARAKKSSVPIDCLKAFLFGGLICTVAQFFFEMYLRIGIPQDTVKIITPCTIIVITAILTGLDLFDNIAKHAGAGTLVPISGFANAVVSPAIDCKTEGYVLGLGAKIFTIAGPVILYGTASSVVYGVIYWISKTF